MTRNLGTFIALAFAASAAVPAARAAEARIPVFARTTITAPGTYFVSRAITGAGPLITISANDVEIDLNGFTLTPTSGAAISANGVSRVFIHDGFLVGGQTAVRLDGVTSATIERVGVSGNTGAGLTLLGSNQVVVRDATIRTSAAEGLLFDAAALASPAQVEISRVQVDAPGTTGIALVNAGSSLIEDTAIGDAGGRGLLLDRCRGVQVEGNAIRASGMAGLVLLDTDGSQIAENIVRLAATDGVVVDAASTDNMLTQNQVTASTGNGIQVGGDRNLLASNHVGGSGSWGLLFNVNASDNVFRTNTARGNTGGACGGGTTDYCNNGVNNTSAGDNYAPTLL